MRRPGAATTREQPQLSATREKPVQQRRPSTTKIKLKKIEKINETNGRFFDKMNKIDKPLTRLTKKKKDPAQQQQQNIYIYINKINF